MSNFSCDEEPTGDMYIFYEHIDKYLKYGNFCNNDNNCDLYGDKCEFKKSTSHEKSDIHTNICKRFKYLIHNILNEVPENKSSNEEADGKYLIYWLNREIHKNNANICPKVFLQLMITSDTENTLLRKMMNYKYYIEDDDVRNMYLLYHLYNNYKEMNEIINSDTPNEKTFMVYANNCVEKYKELKAKCSEKNTHLSNALNIFKTKYEQTKLNKEKLPEWKIEKLPALDDTKDIQKKVTSPSKISTSPVEITIEASVSLEKPALTQSSLTATLADPAALMNQFAESGKSNPSAEMQSLQSGDNTVRSEEIRSTGLKGEGDLSDYTRTIIGPAVGTIGLSSIFFIFYKFTSFGVWLFRGRRNNKNIRMNFDEQRNLFLDTSECHYEYPSRESYNIAYNSA